MNAVRLYLTTCRYVMQAEECVADLYRLLPYLRQALSCCVCGQLLRRPCGPEPNVCQHFVCTGCVGGKMNLKPSCSWCKDSSLFVENTQIWILVHCFKKLCEYLNNSRFVRELQQPTGSNETNGLVLLVQEAMAFDDNYASSIEEKLSAIPSLTTFSLKRKEHPSCDFLNADVCLKTPPTPFHTSHHLVKQEPDSHISAAATTTTAQHYRVGIEERDKVAEKLSSECKEGQTIHSSSSSNKREAVSVRCPAERKKRSLWNSRGELACLSVDRNDNDDDDDEGSNSEIDLQPSNTPCKKFCSNEDNNNNNSTNTNKKSASSSSRKSKIDHSRRSSWSGIIEAVHKHRLISTSGHS